MRHTRTAEVTKTTAVELEACDLFQVGGGEVAAGPKHSFQVCVVVIVFYLTASLYDSAT